MDGSFAPHQEASDFYDSVMVMIEEVYHAIWTCLCAKEIVLDTYYDSKPKRPTPHTVLYIFLFVFHIAFQGRNAESLMLPTKLLYLMDMLFHVSRIAWDTMIFLSVFRCPKDTCAQYLAVSAASAAYHIATLRVYYRWFHVTPAEKPTCLIGSAISWVRQRLTSVPRKESSAVQLQRTLRKDQECSASLEFSQRTTGEGAIRRTISCQSSELVTAT